MNFSVNVENYIKGIYHLQSGEELVNTNPLAVELNTKAASVTDMLKKLEQEKLIQSYHRFTWKSYSGYTWESNGDTAG